MLEGVVCECCVMTLNFSVLNGQGVLYRKYVVVVV